jgi:hypothetical protein
MSKLAAVASAALALGACNSTQGTNESESQSALYGTVTFTNDKGSDCGPEQGFLLQSIQIGRIVSSTDLFASCIQSAMNGAITLAADPFRGTFSVGPYDRCNADPMPVDPVAAVVADTRSPLGLHISCNPNNEPGIAARADLITNPGANETLYYVEPSLIASMSSGDYSWVAATVWHEAMHQHGYDHGTSGKAEDCGYSPTQFSDDDQYWMWRHTVPYIVTGCMKYLGDISAVCGDTTGIVCGKDSIAVRTALDPSADCVCVRDPQAGPPLPPPPPSPPSNCHADVGCSDSVSVRCDMIDQVTMLQVLTPKGTWHNESVDADLPRYVEPFMPDTPIGVDSATYRACAINSGGQTCSSPFYASFPHQKCGGVVQGGSPPSCGGPHQPKCPPIQSVDTP